VYKTYSPYKGKPISKNYLYMCAFMAINPKPAENANALYAKSHHSAAI